MTTKKIKICSDCPFSDPYDYCDGRCIEDENHIKDIPRHDYIYGPPPNWCQLRISGGIISGGDIMYEVE